MAWFKRDGAVATPSHTIPTKTFAEIMREEEDAKLAAKFASVTRVSDFDDDLRLALELSKISTEKDSQIRKLKEDEDLVRILGQELSPSEMDTPKPLNSDNSANSEVKSNHSDVVISDVDTNLKKFMQSENFDEDAVLAKFLQIEERKQAGHLQYQSLYKELTPLEQKLFNLEFGSDESEDEFDDVIDVEEEMDILRARKVNGWELEVDSNEEETPNEYNYDEPFSILNRDNVDPSKLKPQQPRLFDSAQRREDEEIAHVSRRDKNKRPNATFVALHHQNFETRNVGKRQADIFKPFDRDSKPKKDRRDKKERRQYLLGLPYTYPEFYAFGLVECVSGGGHFVVYSFSSGIQITARLTKVLTRSAAVWIEKGDVVVLKTRGCRMIRADILLKLTEDEYFFLPRIGCMSEHDPSKMLPIELMSLIFSFLPQDDDDLESVEKVNEHWRKAVLHLKPDFTPKETPFIHLK
jgi:translation initiation factor IF-1